MDKQNVEEWVPEHVLKLITLKFMMESLIELLTKLLDRMSNDPVYSSLISQQELARKEIEERFSTLNISALGTSHVNEQQDSLGLTTSPINTPKRPDKELFKIWRDELESPSDDPEEVYFNESAKNENVCGSPNEPSFGADHSEESVKDETESDEVCDDRLDDNDNDGGYSAKQNAILKEDLSTLDEVDAMIEAALKDPNRSVYDESLSYFIGESSSGKTEEKPSDSSNTRDVEHECEIATDSNAETETDDEEDHACERRGCMQ